MKIESMSKKRKGKREYLNAGQTRQLMKQLDAFFETVVEVQEYELAEGRRLKH